MISLIVPIRGENPGAADRLGRFLREGESEIVVADGGGGEETARALQAIGARIIRWPGSRGLRQDHAARQSRGDILFFVHADSRPPDDALALIGRAVASGADAGAFSLAYEKATPALVWVAWWANRRSRFFKLPFGDQGIFCRRETYERAGGFRDLPVCDDLDFVRRVKRAGRFVVLPEKTVTSPRRYRESGAFRQVLRNWRVLAGYYAGVSPEKLDRWYRN